MPFQGQVAVVTGGGAGIGRAIAIHLAQQGAALAVIDSDPQAAAASAQAVRALGAAASAHVADVSDPASVAAVFEAILQRHARLDVLVNNAGVAQLKPLMEVSLPELQKLVAVNLAGTLLCTQAAVRAMQGARYGRVVNIGSVAGQRGIVGRGAYGATKAAVHALTQVLAAELARDHITVNAVAPGPIDSALSRRVQAQASQAGWRQALQVKRYGEPQEVAAAVAFLASRAAGYITGQVLAIDGGFLAASDFADVMPPQPAGPAPASTHHFPRG